MELKKTLAISFSYGTFDMYNCTYIWICDRFSRFISKLLIPMIEDDKVYSHLQQPIPKSGLLPTYASTRKPLQVVLPPGSLCTDV